jgi:hypothetical protein
MAKNDSWLVNKELAPGKSGITRQTMFKGDMWHLSAMAAYWCNVAFDEINISFIE